LRNLRSPFFAVLLLVAVLLLIGVPLLTRGALVPPPESEDQPPIEYRSEQFGFRLVYPGNWQALDDPRELIGDHPTQLHAVAFVPDAASNSLVVMYVQTLTATQTLDEFVVRQLAAMQSNEAKVEFTSPTARQLGDAEARETTAMVTSESPARQQRVIMTVKGSRAYALLYSGLPEGRYAQAFDAIVNSFTFLP
jgi:hypothetical protein